MDKQEIINNLEYMKRSYQEAYDTGENRAFCKKMIDTCNASLQAVKENSTLKKALMQEICDSHTSLSSESHQKLFEHYIQQVQEEKDNAK